jgi:hypothetical protein
MQSAGPDSVEVPLPRRQWTARLRLHLDHARELADDGAFVGSHTGFEAWRERQEDWRDATAQTLGGLFEREALAEFHYATLPPPAPPAAPERWRQALYDDLRRIDNAIELLAGLQATLCEGGAPARATVT